jgi:hypothetical protein
MQFAYPFKVSKTSPLANTESVLSVLQEICAAEWGVFPKPVSIGIQDGRAVIKFKNHDNDQKPSTIVLGIHRRLQVNGHHAFGSCQFFLPDHMTADALVNHVYRRCGLISCACDAEALPVQVSVRPNPTLFEKEFCEPIERDFAEPYTDVSHSELVANYRRKLAGIIRNTRHHGPINIIVSVEGIGKTTAHLPVLAEEAFDEAQRRSCARVPATNGLPCERQARHIPTH